MFMIYELYGVSDGGVIEMVSVALIKKWQLVRNLNHILIIQM